VQSRGHHTEAGQHAVTAASLRAQINATPCASYVSNVSSELCTRMRISRFFQFQSLVLHESFEMSSRASLGDLCNSSGCIVNISKQLAVETQGRIYVCGGPG